MKKISATQLNLIDAIVAEYPIGGLNASILEKDVHVTDALTAIVNINDPKIRVVFCGGTSLSKAFGLIERMSEDIDIKIDIAPLQDLTQSARKAYLSQFKEKIRSALTAIGFVEDKDLASANNANQLFSMEWRYQGEYEGVASLRPHLKVEVKTCKITRPTIKKDIDYLINQLVQKNNTTTSTTCQAVEETLSEKVISFLRRLERVGSLNEPWDATLIRHLYDIYCITSNAPQIIEKSKGCFKQLVHSDAEEYGSQQIDFGRNPEETLLKVLSELKEHASLEQDYKDKLIPLVFGDVKPDFKVVMDNFMAVASRLLDQR